MEKARMKAKDLHPILLNPITPPHSDEDFFKGPMRPRANTDPVSPRPRLHVHFDLPDIVVDDCSDNDEDHVDRSRPEEINRALADTDEGAFFVFKSPPRQRSNTCPSNMFSKRRSAKDRPPTPPPKDEQFNKYPSFEKVSFQPHTLSKVTEDAQESSKPPLETKKQHQSRITNHVPRQQKGDNVKTGSKYGVSPPPPQKRTAGPKVSHANNHVNSSKTSGLKDVSCITSA